MIKLLSVLCRGIKIKWYAVNNLKINCKVLSEFLFAEVIGELLPASYYNWHAKISCRLSGQTFVL